MQYEEVRKYFTYDTFKTNELVKTKQFGVKISSNEYFNFHFLYYRLFYYFCFQAISLFF